MEAINILLVEDDDRLASLLKRQLEEITYRVTVAYDGQMAKKLFANEKYNLVITDLILPHINGIALSREIRKLDPNVPIIMLTALGTTDDKVEGFDAGADDYLVKPFDFRELQARIRSLLKRTSGPEKSALPTNLSYKDIRMDLNEKKVYRNNREIHLTPKEFRLMEYLLQHPERVLTRDEIASEVWGVTFDTGTNFIDVYINYLRKKMDKPFDEKLIHTRPGMGFILTSS
ncbi:response regulator transcription factor [Negadavirga shengliensis]|uniref:Response regulator transcription factor n=1 Tax=Negadavirga shengliensis TaxID=1389218 RepID=A0ABV9T6P0_9BACT